jgi:predicted alpha-1,2-mannosidase
MTRARPHRGTRAGTLPAGSCGKQAAGAGCASAGAAPGRGIGRLALALLLAFAAAAGDDPARWVDPFIGTGGHGHTYPGPTLPFGMVQLGPDTRLSGWDGCSGYHATDGVVYGFSHTHLSGTGISDYGDVLLMPMTGEPLLSSGHGRDPDEGYASRFDKRTESAQPGYYAVHLEDAGVGVELTATERAGMHRYRFPAGRPAHVIVDLQHRDRVLESALRVAGDREIEGFRRSTGWARDQWVGFVARFSRPFRATLAVDDRAVAGARGIEGTNVKAILSFGEKAGEVLVKVGLSAVDVDGARRNLDAEMPGWDFDAVRRAARAAWNDALGRIQVEGGSDEQRVIFTTALYHALIAPNLYSDVDGRYRGMDGEVHRAAGRRHYTVFSLWDTFRAAHPLFTLMEPERTREFVETFLAQYEQGGRLPVWELAANETDTMIGYHAAPVIADAWIKGIRGFDAGRALEAMIHSADLDHLGLAAYRRQGFIGSGDEPESVSKTLEYAFDDACIARLAEGMGRDDVAARFGARSQAWRHLLDPQTGFFRARRNQRWLEPFDPTRIDGNYTEANAWQYAFFVPHDLDGLIDALGGDAAFVRRLDALFEADPRVSGRDQPDVTGLIGQYAHGNEPSHHMAWLYHYAGRPDRSADRVRAIVESLYAAAPDGLAGNEDCGQMSAWYVLAAVGLYPVCPCDDPYVLVPPAFDEVRIATGGGRTFAIRTTGEGPYVRSATLDGRPLARSFVRHGEIVAGGDLELALGPAPDRWGVAAADRPRTRAGGAPVLPAPFARSDGDAFRGSLEVRLASADPEAIVRYTLDPGAPRADWPRYAAPLVLRESARVRFVAERGDRQSPVVEAYFHRIPNDWAIEVAAPPAAEYSAGGSGALIDGRRGPGDWRTGGWHGYRGADFEATVDLGKRRPVRRAGAGFLQDVASWIWMPREVVVSVSTDGESFDEVARVRPRADGEVAVRDVVADLHGVEARFVRVRAVRLAAIPEPHPGRGEAAWVFVDEVLVE